MENHDNSPNKRQGQDTYKIEQLKAFVKQSKYIDIKEQPNVCKQFGLPFLRYIFQDEYRNRFYEYLKHHTTTVASVFKATGIPEKYLCQCKAYYESKKLLKVVAIGRCPATGSNNVQFLTTNENLLSSLVGFNPTNQYKMF
tara:strand:+ start:4295 stop:4717 length:423 start_codon:yes stop_codon:yes gene_type:complete